MVSHIQNTWQSALFEGKAAFGRGDFAAGVDLFTSGLSLAHEESAAEPDIGELFYHLGCCLVATGDVEGGRQRLKQALRTFERALGPEAKQTVIVKAQLAALISNQPEEKSEGKVPTNMTTASPAGVYAALADAALGSGAAASGAISKRAAKKGAREEDPNYEQIMAARPAKNVAPIFVEDFIHPREKLYGFFTAAIGIWVYSLLGLLLIGIALAPLAILAGYISAGMHLGHLRSRGIKVSDRQFPEVYGLVDQYSTALNMPPPEVYVVQEHGLLNAFANRLHRKDMIVIYSDVVELAYAMGEKEMAFVVCHELAHIKRGHVKWAWVHMPGDLVPFLGTAYSRACEYTCDRIAAEIVPDGALFGLVCLAAGTKLYRRVNIKALYEQAEEEWGFWTWFTEIQSTHPNLMNRIRAIGLRDQAIKGFKAAAKAG